MTTSNHHRFLRLPLATAIASALLLGCSADPNGISRHESDKPPPVIAKEQPTTTSPPANAQPSRDSVTAPASEATTQPRVEPIAQPPALADAAEAEREQDHRQSLSTAAAKQRRSQDRSISALQSDPAEVRIAPPQPAPTPPLHYQEPPTDNERFTRFDDNPVKATRDDPLSTFGVDVDTASYSLARQALSQGHLPRPEGVRTEEWLNYFSYQYPRPGADEAPFSITTELAPAPWAEGKQLLLVGLQGYDVEPAALPPLNLTFLIDVSGSMSAANKLPLARNALKMLTRKLRPQDRVAIVVYAGAAGLVLDATAGDQHATIIDAIDRLHAGGSTAGGAGIQLAYATARKQQRDGDLSRVILLSDGDFNVGTTSTDALKQMVAAQRQHGVSLSVLTFGRGNIRDELMNALAEIGNGNAGYIDSAHEARRYLVDKMTGSLMTIAQDVKAQIEFNPAQVAEYRLLGYETRHLAHHEFNDDRKDAGEIGAGHSVTALYELTLTDSAAALTPQLRYAPVAAAESASPADSRAELAFLKLRYKRPGEWQSQLLTRPIYRHQLQPSLAAASDNLRWAAAVAGAAQRARGIDALAGWSYADSRALAQSALGTDPDGYRSQFLHLLRTAANLDPRVQISRAGD